MNRLSGDEHRSLLPAEERDKRICRRLLFEAAAQWESGEEDSGHLFLRCYGQLLRMGDHGLPPLKISDPVLLAAEGLHPGIAGQTTEAAVYYLNMDHRRFSGSRLRRWASGFSRLVLKRRDELQLVLDAAFSLGLQAGGPATEFFSRYIAELAQLDEVLLQTNETAGLALRFFQRPHHIDPGFDLSFYWWFGPERRVTARGTKSLLAAYNLAPLSASYPE